MRRSRMGFLGLWACAALVGACGPSPPKRVVVATPVCAPASELDDAIDPVTGLAPVPRRAGAGTAKPSGPLYWRQMTPVPIGYVKKARAVEVGDESACAVTESRGVTCWALPFDRFRYLPEGRDPVELVHALEAPALDGVEAVTVFTAPDGDVKGCARAASETVCWSLRGYAVRRETEAPPPAPPGDPAAAVPGDVQSAFSRLNGVVSIAGDAALACARLESGQVHCASRKPPGPVPSASDFPSEPAPVKGVSATSLSVHGAACAVTSQGAVVCWGHIARTAMFPACEPVK